MGKGTKDIITAAENWATLLGAFLWTCPTQQRRAFIESMIHEMSKPDARVLHLGLDSARIAHF